MYFEEKKTNNKKSKNALDEHGEKSGNGTGDANGLTSHTETAGGGGAGYVVGAVGGRASRGEAGLGGGGGLDYETMLASATIDDGC